MAANVKILKLITGEELLGEIESEFTNPIKIKNPVRIVVMPNKIDPKTPNVGFAPWAEFSDDKEFIIDRSHIVAIINPIKEFINQYNSMFGGIILNPNGPGLIFPGA